MPKVNFKDPAESDIVNQAFVGRTVDDEMSGKYDMTNAEAESGDSVTNVQRKLNENSIRLDAAQTPSGGGELLTNNIARFQIIRVSGDGSPVTLSNTPFGAAPDIQDGTIFLIVGQDDTNTVTINHNDADDGFLLNGNATLLKGYSLVVYWDSNLQRGIQIAGRNF